MTEDLTKVPGGTGAGVPDGTPVPSGVAPATPAKPPVDATSADIEAKYKAELEKFQNDLNKLKSASQRREGELQKTITERERQYREEIEKVRLGNMDEEERKIYEVERTKERVAELEAQLNAVNEEKEEQMAVNNAYSFFLQKGVPANSLVIGQGLDALVASGWEYISLRLAQLEAAAAAGGQRNPPVEPPKAPNVEVGSGTPAGKPTWDDLVKRYGSREEVYTQIEQRRLSPDILPD